MTHDIVALERKIRALGDTIAQVGKGTQVEFLMTIIHRPGWTTLPEYELVLLQVENLQAHVSSLQQGLEALASIAGKIGQDSAQPLSRAS